MDKPKTMKHCKTCGRDRPIEQFYKIYKELEYRRSYCKDCNRAHTKSWLNRKKAEARAKLAKEQGNG